MSERRRTTGGYPSSSKPVSELKPPPAAISRPKFLYHFTCDHGAAGIHSDGYVRPAVDLTDKELPLSGQFAWFTDLLIPDRNGLGLTSHILGCDRTAHRFRVTDMTEVERWTNVRRYHPEMARELEFAPGAMPMHWWLSTKPVPVASCG